MASQAETSIQGQSSVSTAAPPKTTAPGDEPFSAVTRNNGVAFKPLTKSLFRDNYIDAFVNNIPPEEVVSVSRISNGRVAIYLCSRGAVIDATNHGLILDDSFLELTPLIKPTTRLTLSNVYPEIPNSVLVTVINTSEC